jgi:hypothetical protein
MAVSLALRVALDILGEITVTGDLVANTGSVVPVRLKPADTVLTSGVGTGQVDKIYQDTGQIAASGTNTLDLSGGSLSDPLSAALTFVKLKALVVVARSTNNVANNILVTRPASNGAPIFSAASDAVPLHPGSILALTWPGAGITVTAGTGDLIDLTNSAGTNAVDYDIVLAGTSA